MGNYFYTIFLFIFFTLNIFSENSIVEKKDSQLENELNKPDDAKENIDHLRDFDKTDYKLSSKSDIAKKFTDFIGEKPKKVFELFGAPAKLEIFNNEIISQQEDNLYFFWHDNRLWQIAFPKNYEKEFLDIKIGATTENVKEKFGAPYKKTENILYYRLSANVFPIFLKIVFKEDKVLECYIYRADM